MKKVLAYPPPEGLKPFRSELLSGSYTNEKRTTSNFRSKLLPAALLCGCLPICVGEDKDNEDCTRPGVSQGGDFHVPGLCYAKRTEMQRGAHGETIWKPEATKPDGRVRKVRTRVAALRPEGLSLTKPGAGHLSAPVPNAKRPTDRRVVVRLGHEYPLGCSALSSLPPSQRLGVQDGHEDEQTKAISTLFAVRPLAMAACPGHQTGWWSVPALRPGKTASSSPPSVPEKLAGCFVGRLAYPLRALPHERASEIETGTKSQAQIEKQSLADSFTDGFFSDRLILPPDSGKLSNLIPSSRLKRLAQVVVANASQTFGKLSVQEHGTRKARASRLVVNPAGRPL